MFARVLCGASGSVNLKVTTWQLLLNLTFLNFQMNGTELIFVEQLMNRNTAKTMNAKTIHKTKNKTTPAETNPTYIGFKLWSRMFHALGYF